MTEFTFVLNAIETISFEKTTPMLRGLAKINRQEIEKTDPQDYRRQPPS